MTAGSGAALAAALIEKLGRDRFAHRIGVTPAYASLMKTRGVPQVRRPLVAELARIEGVDVPEGFVPRLAPDDG